MEPGPTGDKRAREERERAGPGTPLCRQVAEPLVCIKKRLCAAKERPAQSPGTPCGGTHSLLHFVAERALAGLLFFWGGHIELEVISSGAVPQGRYRF